MTPHQITLVQESFRFVAPIRTAAAALFYEKLFDRDPTIAAMFARTNLAVQGDKLMMALAFVVQGLARPGEMLPAVRDLGRRHRDYGVEDAQYETVGAALLETLADGLGPKFTPETQEAWATAYALLSGVMIAASRGHRLAEDGAVADHTAPVP